MAKDVIKIVGAREHNLKDLTLSIPRDRLVVMTGLSGSGKSSLAFDTIYAEGQRKYVESLSAFARQFLNQLKKPDVDYIEGLSPSIAIEQRSSGTNPRSIIATTTEIYDYLRLLFAHVGQPHCPDSGQPISHLTTTEIVDKILEYPSRTRAMILAPVVQQKKGEFRDVLERLAREGFVRARVDGQLVELAANARFKLDPSQEHSIDAVVDRLVMDESIRTRLSDSVETALKWGEGILVLLHQPPGTQSSEQWHQTTLSNRNYSPATGRSFEPVTPKHFSFNSPQGACSECLGLGQTLVFDEDLVVPNPDKSLDQGAIVPWAKGGKRLAAVYQQQIADLAEHYQVSTQIPYRKLPETFRRVLMQGSGREQIPFTTMREGNRTTTTKSFEGVIPNLERLYEQSESETTRHRLKAYMSPQTCPFCLGQRLKPELLSVRLGDGTLRSTFLGFTQHPRPPQGSRPEKLLPDNLPGLSIMDVCALPIDVAYSLFCQIKLDDFHQRIATDVIREIRSRLEFLKNVGLGYLTLNRESGTLSGGEAQRIRLATQIGAGLVGVLYILDEPSIGLHQRDNERLLTSLQGLRDLGNSVIVVEHDEDTIRRADYVIDLGPGAGVHGGELVAAGTPADIAAHPHSLTGKYLNGSLSIPVPKKRIAPSPTRGWIEVLGARENNLKNIHARFPLGTLTCVTGVSGSGKSTLVDDVLRRALFRQYYGSRERPGAHTAIRGAESLEKIIVIDQTPIGRTPRSNPATYTGIFNLIRDLFARLPTARIRGYDAGRFSFNVKGGRCEKCQGDGVIKIEMHFLPPVYVTCEACEGRRYNRETLEITYKGLNIADVLDLTVDEAVHFFRAVSQIRDVCMTLAEVGLGYIRLGQQATTLSGGEAQRVKLASELSRRTSGRALYILDEPTTGLHFHDVSKLLEVLFKLRAPGNTLLVIEHNLDIIKNADWILDIGPEGGEEGGQIVAEGTPETVAKCKMSHTARFLSPLLDLKKPIPPHPATSNT